MEAAKMKFAPFLLIATLAGCATVKVPEPITGSKADGIVTLAYEVGLFEKPVIDWDMAKRTAQKRCVSWNYKNAEAFSGAQTKCTAYNGNGDCIHEEVHVTYQCIN